MSVADSPPADVAERITVGVPPAGAYQAISDVHRMARWSPECFAVLVWSRRGGLPARFVGLPARFVGLNRRGPWVWFTTCRVVAARPGEEFAFDITTFGMPVARWSYRLAGADGGTEVTECWWDQRGRGCPRARADLHRPGRQQPGRGQPRGHADDPGAAETRAGSGLKREPVRGMGARRDPLNGRRPGPEFGRGRGRPLVNAAIVEDRPGRRQAHARKADL